LKPPRSLGRARAVLGIQLLLGIAVLGVAGVGYADAEDPAQSLAMTVVAALGLSQVAPALVGEWLIRRGRVRGGLFLSGAAAFVPGAMITYLALTSFRALVVLVVGPVGALLMAIGFHQLWVRSRVP
jgi:hypothetical protein